MSRLEFLRDVPPCLIGLEACATAHFWAREIGALGHDVRLIPPAYVKPYVKRQKNDAADAEAICEAVTRPNMRFVPVKSADRQGVLMLHRTRDLLMRQRTMTLNAVRAHLAEFGIITAQGPHKLLNLIRAIRQGEVSGLRQIAAVALESLTSQLDTLAGEVRRLERQLMAWHRADETSQRLETIPGVGVITATALAASVPDPSVFKTGRQFAAFLGLVPRQNSSGGKDRLGRISKWAMVICAGFWSSVLPRWCGAPTPTRRRPVPGCDACSSVNQRDWSPWRLPTKPPGSPGPYSHGARRIVPRWRHKSATRSQGHSSPRNAVRANVSDDDQTGPQPGKPEVVSGLKSSLD
jgi:transposase